MPRYYDFKVSLRDIKPRIWRRFLLAADATFEDLHDAIQASFGWGDCHLHQFTAPGRDRRPLAGLPDPDRLFGPPVPDERRVKLSRHFESATAKPWCLYTYDFGDDWLHEVKLMRVVTSEERFERRLVGGERSAPPEDCGSVPGYYRMVELVETGEDPWEEDTAELQEWLGGWKPDAFDLEVERAAFDR